MTPADKPDQEPSSSVDGLASPRDDAPTLEVELRWGDGASVQCPVRDFRFGRLSLELDGSALPPREPAVGDVAAGDEEPVAVTVAVAPPDGDGVAPFEIAARLAAATADGVDVELLEPSREAIAALDELAYRARHPSEDRPALGPGERTASAMDARERALEVCRTLVDAYLDARVRQLFESAREGLFTAARDAGDAAEEERLLAVCDEVDRLRGSVGERFVVAVRSHMRTLGECDRLSPTLETAVEPESRPALSLVDSNRLDDWVMLRGILDRHRARLADDQYALERRLAAAAGVRLDEDNDPVGVQGMSALFHLAAVDVESGKLARSAVFEAFETSVIEPLAELFSSMNATLREHGVLHELAPRGAPTPMRSPLPRHADRASEEAPPLRDLHASRLGHALLAALRSDPRFGDGPLPEPGRVRDALSRALARSGVPETRDGERSIEAFAAALETTLQDERTTPEQGRRLWRFAVAVATLGLHDPAVLERELASLRHDPVTGLLDGAALATYLDRAIERLEPGGATHSLCLFEVDRLGSIVDEYGSETGGRLMRTLAGLIRQCAPETSHLSRIGGGMFAVFLDGRGVAAAERFSQRFIDAVGQTRWVYRGQAIPLRVSGGIVALDRARGGSTELLRAAEQACRAARGAGGGIRVAEALPKSR